MVFVLVHNRGFVLDIRSCLTHTHTEWTHKCLNLTSTAFCFTKHRLASACVDFERFAYFPTSNRMLLYERRQTFCLFSYIYIVYTHIYRPNFLRLFSYIYYIYQPNVKESTLFVTEGNGAPSLNPFSPSD